SCCAALFCGPPQRTQSAAAHTTAIARPSLSFMSRTPGTVLLEHANDDAPVLGAPVLRGVRRDRAGLAVGDHADRMERNAALLVQVVAHRFCALRTELVVVLVAPDVVGVPLDLDVH